MLIDIHAHVIPGEFPAWNERPAGADAWPSMTPTGTAAERLLEFRQVRFTARTAWFDAEQRLADMEASGTDAEVLSPMPPLLDYQLSPGTGRDLARWVNEFIALLCQASPSRFFGLGTVPLQDPGLAATELGRIVDMGLAGIEIGSNVNGVSLGDDRFTGFFAEAQRLSVPVFVHALRPVAGGGRLPPAAMAGFGFASEIGVAAASVLASQIPEKLPGLRLCFSHGAGALPMMLPREQFFWSGTWNEDPPVPERAVLPGRAPCSPMSYARRYYYDTLVFDRRALAYLIDLIGPSQLIVGTDFPAVAREQPAGRTLRSLGLPAAVLEDITWHNCFRFLGKEPPAPAPS